MSRLVRLEPPYSRSGANPHHYSTIVPLTRGPRLVRTGGMSRWHRPRSGTHHSDHGRTSFTLWCGQLVRSTDLIQALTVPDGEPLCGTCEGRAVGAGHPPVAVEVRSALLFEPASRYRRPPWCPAGKLWLYDTLARTLPWRETFGCPVCSEHVRTRAAGGWANSHVKIAAHPPVGDMVAPCPFHGWDQLGWRVDERRAVCGCARPVQECAL